MLDVSLQRHGPKNESWHLPEVVPEWIVNLLVLVRLSCPKISHTLDALAAVVTCCSEYVSVCFFGCRWLGYGVIIIKIVEFIRSEISGSGWLRWDTGQLQLGCPWLLADNVLICLLSTVPCWCIAWCWSWLLLAWHIISAYLGTRCQHSSYKYALSTLSLLRLPCFFVS